MTSNHGIMTITKIGLPGRPFINVFFFLVEVVVLFFFVGGEDSGRKNLEGHGRGPMNECMMYLLIGEVLCFFYGSGHHDFPREYFVCMFIRKW